MHDKARLALGLVGIGFAVLLMCMQVGFRYALLDSTVELVRRFEADLVITNRVRYTMLVKETFPLRRLAQAKAIAGVVSAEPLYVQVLLWKYPNVPLRRPIRVIAYDPAQQVLDIPEVLPLADSLAIAGHALLDEQSDPESFGPAKVGIRTELAGQQVEIVGTFNLGKDFANAGNLVTSSRNYAKYMQAYMPFAKPLDYVDAGLVRVAEGADPEVVRKALAAALPNDVRVFTMAEFIAQEESFWLDATPIGTVFFIGLIVGFVVGVIICYQILHTLMSMYIREFATLKAMGYKNAYFMWVVLQQSLFLSILGFIPGLIVSLFLYNELARRTGLLLVMTPGRAGIVLACTMAMCFVSGCLTVRKVLAADPAELF